MWAVINPVADVMLKTRCRATACELNKPQTTIVWRAGSAPQFKPLFCAAILRILLPELVTG